ncbi:HNH endonuclease, partial [Arthrobacter sp. ISL-5]|nr:HNH endonuclease [Arthrobacter sp. ISL-5]
MEAIGEGASSTAARAAMPGRRTSPPRSVPDSGALTPASLAGAPAVADTSASDGGAAAGFGAASLGAAGLGAAGVGTAGGDAMTTGATDSLKRCLDLLGAAVGSAPGELALAGFPAAAEFAGLAEEISRGAEYLQLLGAAAVDRTHTEAINAAGPASKAAGWTTGWGTGTDDGTEAAATSTTSASPAAAPFCADEAAVGTAASSSAATSASASAAVPAVSPADDGSRNTAEFLRTRLRIGAGEARRRLALASAILPRTGITGQPMPPAYEETA